MPASREADGERAGANRCSLLPRCVVGRDQPVADRGDAEQVERDRHRRRGEVPGTGTGAGARGSLERVELVTCEQAPLFGADRLPDVLDRHRASRDLAGAHRAAVEDDRGLVHARERHQGRGRRLVAADEADERVEIVSMGHQLDRVGDHLARDQRCPHSRRPLRLVVRDGDRVELERDAACLGDAVGDAGRQPSLVQVAGHRLRPGRRDADDRAAEPRGVDAHRPKMRAGRRALCRRCEPGARPPPERLLRRRHAGITQRVYVGLASSLRTLGIARIASVWTRNTPAAIHSVVDDPIAAAAGPAITRPSGWKASDPNQS